jgi:signal transduction histidine kinase
VRRGSALAAGTTVVVAATWTAVLAHVLARWPAGASGVAIVAAVAAAVVITAAVALRWSVRQRDARAAVEERALAASVTVIASGTLFAAIVLAIGGRPSSDSADAMRACLVALIVTALLLGTLARRIGRRARHVVHGRGGPRRQLLEQFGRGLARPASLDETLHHLVETVRPACAADAADVWLLDGGALALHAAIPARHAAPIFVDTTRATAIARAGVSGDGWADSWLPELRGDPHDHVRVAPFAAQGELLGLLVARRHQPADDFDDADDEGLGRVVRLVAAALRNAALDAELRRTVLQLQDRNTDLQRSRARIVSVADDERRRLERDLHDGAQSQLMGIAVKVRLARDLVDDRGSDGAGLPELLAEIEQDLATASGQLRTLAHGIFPPLLLTGGLADAVGGIASHASATVRVAHVTHARFDPQVEAAVYFCCLEAVQNAAKHAGDGATVTIDVRDDGGLTLRVCDDGAGFDPATAPRGHGFTNMADRLGALGGSLDVSSAPGRGTTVTGTVPEGSLRQVDSPVR